MSIEHKIVIVGSGGYTFYQEPYYNNKYAVEAGKSALTVQLIANHVSDIRSNNSLMILVYLRLRSNDRRLLPKTKCS